MSFEAMHKVRASGLSDRTQVDVLEALAFFLNQETGACFPSTESIARISRVNDRTVRLTLKSLHDLGFVSSIQNPGQKRYFTLHLDRLPLAEPLQESTPLYEGTPLQKVTVGEELTPLQKLTPNPCKNLQETPVKTYREPLQKLTPEQVINKEINKIKNKVCIATYTEPLENLVKDIPENGDTPESVWMDTPENGEMGIHKNGVTHTPENGDRTGNKNREIEQRNRTEKLEAQDAPEVSLVTEEKTKRTILKKPDGVSDDLWDEWKKFRRNKRLSITERVLNNLTSEAEKAGLTIEQAMNIQLDREWRGFKAEWVKNKQPQQHYGFHEKKQEERHYELW